ncbi:sporulation-control protein [Peribacillus deserti]|uniref:Sporulation-control protein n=1 Tax=Peribacillus deserti TaxID=673318 RepID=A0ABS2QHZ4_9BACI|nr:sporulation protein [Peribacillus deserti]MBM7692781.1 sporulation-control protein [Peribacillus deserti]
MLLRKYMALIGVGSAKIDLILQKDTFKPGDAVHGYFLIEGGTIEQKIKRIDCDLIMTDKAADTEKIIDSAAILTTQLIESEESNKITFTFKLPDSVPISSKEISYRFKTKLTFDEGVESRDMDKIQIVE